MTPTSTLAERLRDQEEAVRGMVPPEAFETFAQDARALGEAHRGQGLRVGDDAPDFRLPDAEGHAVALADLLAHGPAVVAFYRGTWCPYCNVQLHAYQQALPEIQKAGASLVAISPQTLAQSHLIAENNRLAFPVLSDRGNSVARRYVPVFAVGEAPREALHGLGVSLSDFSGEDADELPVPGTFVIDRRGVVRLAFVEGDFRQRLDPAKILATLKDL